MLVHSIAVFLYSSRDSLVKWVLKHRQQNYLKYNSLSSFNHTLNVPSLFFYSIFLFYLNIQFYRRREILAADPLRLSNLQFFSKPGFPFYHSRRKHPLPAHNALIRTALLEWS